MQYGALLQFEKGQCTCGVELGTMLIDAYTNEDKVSYSDDAFERLLKVLRAVPKSGCQQEILVNGQSKLKLGILKWLHR